MSSDGDIVGFQQQQQPPSSPFAGLVEFDPIALANTVQELATSAVNAVGAVTGVAITTQRASTVVWDRSSGEPVGPGLSWQDLRTVGECMTARSEHGVTVAPNQSAMKAQWLLQSVESAEPNNLCIGTVDSWITWMLSRGEPHVTDHTNAAVTGWYDPQGASWSEHLCDVFTTPTSMLPQIVNSVGECAIAHSLPGAPPIVALIGDQQASLVGQGCVSPGLAKITLGRVACLTLSSMMTRPRSNNPARRRRMFSASLRGQKTANAHLVLSRSCWQRAQTSIGSETISRSFHQAPRVNDIASSCSSTDGVMFVPHRLDWEPSIGTMEHEAPLSGSPEAPPEPTW